MSITRQDLFTILSSGDDDIEDQFKFLKGEIKKRTQCPESNVNDLNKALNYFKSQFRSRWLKAHRMQERFLKDNRDWLGASILFPRSQKRRGRPETSFVFSAERTKRHKTSELRKSTPLAVLSYATQMSLRASGKAQASKVIQEITTSPKSLRASGKAQASKVIQEITTSPKRAIKYRKAYKKVFESEQRQMLSGEDALAMLVDAKLSRHQYEVIRKKAPEKFPSYKVLQVAKQECYPKSDCIKVTSTSAEVSLQALLDHTMNRLISVQQRVVNELNNAELQVVLVYQMGF
ncbi:hypothetical protein QE152_g6036 [Popillia japonica]|uniref:Uncharacterized protein n=1 Tax=Popillia japonica TaxID=7064 RepID=A0AAW1MGL8_POPJA